MDAPNLLAALNALVDSTLGNAPIDGSVVAETLARIGISADAQNSLGDKVRRNTMELGRLRRREREVAVLFSSIRELAELRDVDALLGRLVARAHEMMGSDVTYLSEFDPATRDLHVRKTVGSVSPQLKGLRVPAGMGLASRIADSRAAQWVQRYGENIDGRRDEGVDGAVAEEGIVSILGVPMLAEGRVLGVLFTATRHEYTFTPDETALLSALADHASVALQTANKLKQVQDSNDEARQALERLTAVLEERDRSNVVHQELVQAVLLGGGFPQVVGTLAQSLGRSVTIIDSGLRLVAASEPAMTEPGAVLVAPPVRAAIATSRTTGHCCFVDEDDSAIELVASITAGELNFGAVLVGPGTRRLGPLAERTIERAAQVGALLVLQQNAVADADRRVRVDLVTDLLDPAPERRRDLESRARGRDVVLSTLDTVILISVPAAHRTATVRVVTQMVGLDGLVAEHAGMVVAVHSSAVAHLAADKIRTRVRDSIHDAVLAIAAPPALSPDDLPTRFDAGLRTARLLEALGTDDAVVTTDAYLPYAIIFDADASSLHAFLDQTIGVVRRYDAERGTDLLATLRAFVRNDASPTKTGRALSYHTNTILQRLDRLKALLGPDWRSDEQLFRISAAVRLDELRERYVRPPHRNFRVIDT